MAKSATKSVKSVKPVPKGFHTVTPYLRVKGCSQALDFYHKALGAVERDRMTMPDGRIGHAEITIGDSIVMLADEFPDMKIRGPQSLGGTSVGLLLYVKDVDAAFERALDAGAKVLRPVQDQFYGDRSGSIVDPFGHEWTLSTHKEDVDPDEMKIRAKEAFAKMAT
jgi:PhnB protein